MTSIHAIVASVLTYRSHTAHGCIRRVHAWHTHWLTMVKHWRHAGWTTSCHAWGHEAQWELLVQLEAPGRTSRLMVVEWEVPVRVRITPARSDVSWVENICVDEVQLRTHTLVPVGVTFFNVLSPELDSLEELCTFWHLAAELVAIFLCDKLCFG